MDARKSFVAWGASILVAVAWLGGLAEAKAPSKAREKAAHKAPWQKRPERRSAGPPRKPPSRGVVPHNPQRKMRPAVAKSSHKGHPSWPGYKGRPVDARRHQAHNARVSNQRKADELHKLARCQAAQRRRLAEQYHMHRHGDVARRMELQKYRHPSQFHRGPVHPAYRHPCVKHHYWGPRFFDNRSRIYLEWVLRPGVVCVIEGSWHDFYGR